MTATEALDEIQGPPGSLAGFNYHLWVLDRHELIEPTGELSDCNRHYRLTNRGRLALEALSFEEGAG